MDINKYTPSYGIDRMHLTGVLDLSSRDIFEILYAIKVVKSKYAVHENVAILKDVAVALMFAESSIRTRTTLEIGVRQLGGLPVYLPSDDGFSAGENVKDVITIMSHYGVGAVVTRGIKQKDVEQLCTVSAIPVINSSNERAMPLQALSDLFTIWEKKNRLEGLKLAYVGKCGSCAASLVAGAVMCGMEVSVASPVEYGLSNEILNGISQFGSVKVTDNPVEAVRGADVVYTDSYPLSDKEELLPYQVNNTLMSVAQHNPLFMHPLPAVRGLEVTPDIIDGKNSVVIEQGENKLHTVKAVLAMLVK